MRKPTAKELRGLREIVLEMSVIADDLSGYDKSHKDRGQDIRAAIDWIESAANLRTYADKGGTF